MLLHAASLERPLNLPPNHSPSGMQQPGDRMQQHFGGMQQRGSMLLHLFLGTERSGSAVRFVAMTLRRRTGLMPGDGATTLKRQLGSPVRWSAIWAFRKSWTAAFATGSAVLITTRPPRSVSS